MQLLPFLSFFSYLSYLGHTSILGFQTRPEDRATLLLSSRSSPIIQRHPWAPRWTFLCMLSVSARKSASRKKWYVLVPLDELPYFNHHWIALELLYNMRLEPSFSMERFPSYTLTKIDTIRHFNARFITMYWSIDVYIQMNKTRYFYLFLGHTSCLGMNQKLYWCLGAFTTSLYHPTQDDSWHVTWVAAPRHPRLLPAMSVCEKRKRERLRERGREGRGEKQREREREGRGWLT